MVVPLIEVRVADDGNPLFGQHQPLVPPLSAFELRYQPESVCISASRREVMSVPMLVARRVGTDPTKQRPLPSQRPWVRLGGNEPDAWLVAAVEAAVAVGALGDLVDAV